jgi:hypothetical protein
VHWWEEREGRLPVLGNVCTHAGACWLTHAALLCGQQRSPETLPLVTSHPWTATLGWWSSAPGAGLPVWAGAHIYARVPLCGRGGRFYTMQVRLDSYVASHWYGPGQAQSRSHPFTTRVV